MIYSSDLKYITRVNETGKFEAPEIKRKVFVSYRKNPNRNNKLSISSVRRPSI